jgi:hypothetical protein
MVRPHQQLVRDVPKIGSLVETPLHSGASQIAPEARPRDELHQHIVMFGQRL